jgi:hypothetical protein
MENFENARFSGKGRQPLHTYKRYMTIRNMLISYVKLDHTLYSINYGSTVLGSALGPCLGSLRTKLVLCGILHIPSQVDQKGSEKKLGEVFRSTITTLGSCLVKYVDI